MLTQTAFQYIIAIGMSHTACKDEFRQIFDLTAGVNFSLHINWVALQSNPQKPRQLQIFPLTKYEVPSYGGNNSACPKAGGVTADTHPVLWLFTCFCLSLSIFAVFGCDDAST